MDTGSARVTVRAPAKVNLVLAVGSVRPDGYHELATVFHAISLYDEVVAHPDDEITVTTEGVQADRVPAGESNLAAQAAIVLAEYTGIRAGVRLQIHKRIPVAGGLAGGSADAAAALVACDALWETGMGRPELATLAARLGSDVPFGLVGGTALGDGRGEQLTPVIVGGTFHWVIALAGTGLSTPHVYAELDRQRTGDRVRSPEVGHGVLTALRAGDAEELAASVHNDLQEAACALEPSLRTTLATGLEHGALAAMVSGSGPTCVFLARDADDAAKIASTLAAAEVCGDVLQASGPVSGARVV